MHAGYNGVGLNVESACFETSRESEVMEAAQATGDAFGQLQRAIVGFRDAIGQSGFHLGQDAIKVALTVPARSQKGASRKRWTVKQPDFELRPVAAGQSILQKLTQSHRAAQGRIGGHEL